MLKKTIVHIDMDYFFAQIEERENPWMKGKPVIVGADPKKGKGRGVVSTCNYLAREYKIKSGMAISRAYKLAPQGIFLPVNMPLYKKTSDSIFKTVKKVVPSSLIEKVSVDEAYIDITAITTNKKEALKIGGDLKKEIFKKEKLSCTVGISENKMISKIACQLAKPDGLKLIDKQEGRDIIKEMNIQTIPGIGPKTEKVIKELIKIENPTIKDALEIKKEELVRYLGKRGNDFYQKFRGIDASVVTETKEAKSVSKEHTFSKDTRSPDKIIKVFKGLVDDVLMEVKEGEIKNIVVVCRFEDFKTYQKQLSLDKINGGYNSIVKSSTILLLKFLVSSNKKIRLVGFRVGLKNKL